MSFFGANNVYNTTAIGEATVGNTTTVIKAAETARKYCALTNTGNKDCWINYGAAAVVDQGQLLERNGGSLEVNQEALHLLAINGITSSGTTTIAFLEGTLV